MADTEIYAYSKVGASVGFSPLKGPTESGGKVLAYARSAQVYDVSAVDTFMCGLTWDSLPEEYVDAGVTVEGTADVNMDVRVSFTRGEDFSVAYTAVQKVYAGVPTLLTFPWVLDLTPAGTWRWRMKLKTSVGTFHVALGDARWFISRLNR